MTLRLNGSTSGYTEIDAPAVAGSNTLVLPSGNGTSGQVLQTNGSGALSWSSDVMLSAGSASAPSLYFSGDTNTGMWSPAADTLAWSTGGSERMRITSDGRIGLGTSSVYSSTRADTYTNNSVWFIHTFRQDEATGYGIGIGSDGSALAYFYPNSALSGAPVGTITHNGSSTTYATSSDYRLKQNIASVTDGITRLQQLKPCRFNFKANPGHTVDGFIAHEAAEVVPECATGAKDEVDTDGNPVYQGIDQSKLVPLLTAALQEAVAKIESLEARIAALEVTP